MTDAQGMPQETRGQAVAHTATEQAGELGDTVRDQAAEVASTAREHAVDMVGTARDQAAEVLDRSREAVEREARDRTDELARSVRRIGDGLEALADGRPEQAGPVTGYARDAAQRVDQLARRLETRGYDGVVQDVSSFARRRPGVFLASAGLLGFAVGRIIRSGGASGSPGGPSALPGPSLAAGTGAAGVGAPANGTPAPVTAGASGSMPSGSTPLPAPAPSGTRLP